MATLLLHNADVVGTFDDSLTELEGASIEITDGWITWMGPAADAPSCDETVDLRGHVVLPGLVNTHHHLYQTLTRAVRDAQDAPLFDWLTTLYPIWARMTPDDVRTATELGLAELALAGCTTAFDHHYVWPNGSRLDDQVAAAELVGVRTHLARGGMTLGESDGGLPPDEVVETHDEILADYRRTLDLFHDPSEGSMLRVVVAPCSPFSVTTELMRDSAEFARENGLRLHTHLAETSDEESFCEATFGMRPVSYAESVGWAGDDVWFAHAVHVAPDEIDRMAASRTGVAHCPASNMRLASGIAPVRQYLDAGVPTAIGVDGSASNDAGNLIAEVRLALLLQRLAASPGVGDGAIMSARSALRMATRGGAEVLGRTDIGALQVGRAGDVIAIDLNRPNLAGALHDPIAAVVLCGVHAVDHSWVHGRRIVEGGRLTTLEVEPLIERHNRASRRIVAG